MNSDLDQIWNSVLEAMRLVVSSGTYATYVVKTKLVGSTQKGERYIYEVACQNPFIKDTLEKRYLGQLADELERITKTQAEIRLVVKNFTAETKVVEESGPLFTQSSNPFDDGVWRRAKLRPENTFESYAVGGSNQMAFAAAQAVARQPGRAYNPLFIYGGVGVGKTHLMQAIGSQMVHAGETAVLFCSGEEFTNDLVEAIRFKTTDKVRTKYRRMNLLMIDDVQFIAGKPTIQEEFFHTFNSITAEGGQVVMTSDKPPSEIAKLEERLRSRFGAGLLVDIGQPDFELRTAILLIKAKQRNIDLPMETAQLIATHIEGVRELQGFLTKMITESELNNLPLTHERVEKALKITEPQTNTTKVVTPNDAMNVISLFYGVGLQQLKGERRTKTVAWPRQVLMYTLHTEIKLPLEEVGRLLGGRDHTTVLHARDKVIGILATDTKFKNEFEQIKRKLFSV